jgi:hypothetical protein
MPSHLLRILLLLSTSLQAGAADFVITIARQYRGADCTSGYLLVNGEAKMYALERPWKGNEPDLSSIPPGTYGGILRYDKNDHWRIQLTGVKDRPGIQIHVGNKVDDSTGCILVGRQINTQTLCELTDSKAAYAQLKKAFYGSDDPKATPDKKIVVEVK